MTKRKPPNAGKGRGKGNLNKTTLAAKEFAEAMLNREAYEKSLQQRLDEGKAPHMEVLLHHYRSGKPKDTVRVEEAPTTLQVIALRSREDMQLLKGTIDVDAVVPDDDSDDDA